MTRTQRSIIFKWLDFGFRPCGGLIGGFTRRPNPQTRFYRSITRFWINVGEFMRCLTVDMLRALDPYKWVWYGG